MQFERKSWFHKIGNLVLATLWTFSLEAWHQRAASAAETWSDSIAVSSDVAAEGAQPQIATDEKGRFTAAWQREVNGRSLYSRSTDFGGSWTSAVDLPLLSGFESSGNPAVAADVTSSTFMSAWEATTQGGTSEIAYARATLTESDYTAGGVLPYSGSDLYSGLQLPAIEAGGNRTWVAAASTVHSSTEDEALALFRTTDDGDTWTFQGLLGSSVSALEADRNVDLGTDLGRNAYVAVWERRYGSATSPTDIEIFYSRSADDGVTWTAPVPLNSAAPDGSEPTIATFANNAFAAAYRNGTGPGSIKVQRSVDGGATWSGPISVNTAGAPGHEVATEPHLASDGQGNLVLAWTGGTTTRKKLFYSTSEDSGLSWSAADVMSTAPAGQDVSDYSPQVRYDGNGRWVSVWQRTRFGTGAGHQILTSNLLFPLRADLSVTQTDRPDPAKVGQLVTYKMIVRNSGPLDATGVVLTCTPPTTNTVEIKMNPSGSFSVTSETIIFDIGEIKNKAIVTAEFSVQLNKTGHFENTAVLTSNEADTDVGDRTSTEKTTVLIEGIDLQGEWTSFLYKVPRRIERGRLDIDATLNYSNFGTKRARAGIITWYLSDDELLSDDDAFVGRRHVDMLLKGRTREIRLKKTLSRYIPWENRYLIAILDAEKRIHEVDESNNVVMSELLVVP